MVPRLWVPLTHSCDERNWKRASSGWFFTTPMVAKRVSTSTPLRRGAVVSVRDMMGPPNGLWWVSGGDGRRRKWQCREARGLALERVGEPDLQLDEAHGVREGAEVPGDREDLSQGRVTPGVVAGQGVLLAPGVPQGRVD